MIPGQLSKPGVTVAVCTFNGGSRLSETLSHIFSQDVPDHIPWEVVVVDNASTDNTAEIAAALQPEGNTVSYRVVQEPVQGVQSARLRVLRESRYDYLCFVDDDNWLEPDYVRVLYRVFSGNPEVAACGGESELPDELEAPWWFHRWQVSYAVGEQGVRRGVLPLEMRGVWGAGMGLRKSAWKGLITKGYRNILCGRVGKKMVGGEESELMLALQLAGWRIWYEPGLRLKHAIDPGRLCWRYLRRNYRGQGATEVWLNIYARLLGLTKSKKPLTDRWLSLFIPEFIKLLERSGQAFLAWRNTPGVERAVKYERRMGYLGELYRNRKRYGEITRELRSAPWIKKQSKSMQR